MRFRITLFIILLVYGCAGTYKNALKADKPDQKTAAAPLSLKADDKKIAVMFNDGLKNIKDDPQAALAIYKDLAILAPDRWEIYYNTAVIYIKLNEMKKAEEEMLRAIKHRAPQAEAYSALGTVYAGIGSNAKAAEAFERALNHSKSLNTLINVANVYQTMGQNEKAVKYYRQAESLEPENQIIHYNMGILFYKMGRLKRAHEEFSKAVDYVKANIKASHSLAQTLLKLGEYEAALNILKEAAGKYPDDQDTYKYMGIIYEIYMDDMENAALNYNTYLSKGGSKVKDVEIWIDIVKTKTQSNG